jgi:transposase-like protein
MNAKALSDIRRKLRILEYAKQIRNVSKTCRHFGISGEIFYQWKREYEREGEKALINSKPCPQNPKLRVPRHVEELILHLRTTYYQGEMIYE